jgi:hypothetical protein
MHAHPGCPDRTAPCSRTPELNAFFLERLLVMHNGINLLLKKNCGSFPAILTAQPYTNHLDIPLLHNGKQRILHTSTGN